MSPSTEERESFELVRRANILLPGAYAWAATVLYPVAAHGTGVHARVSAALAMMLLLSGVAVGKQRPALGRTLGLHGFVAACVATWLLVGTSLAVDRLDPVKAALGGIGWVVFAFGWGASREPTRVPEDDPRALPGAPLAPKGHLPAGAFLILAVAITGATLPIGLAWRVTRPSHALLAQAVSIACAVALISSGAQIATRRGAWIRVEPPSRRLAQAVWSLIALVAVVALGLAELFSG